MKNFIVIFSILFLTTMLLDSCNNAFLERFPLDEISEETFWNTENDIKIYNNRIYETSRKNDQINIDFQINLYGLPFLDNWTDIYATTDYFRDQIYQRSGKIPVPASPQQHGWKGWDLLREINVGLKNYYRADIPKEIIDKYAAEAKFFRAWFFSDKVQLFGDVPWVGKPLNTDSEELFGPRMPREQAMDSVLADINFAVEHLPINWVGATSTSTAGRFLKWHALLLKARIALFEGTWRKYHGGTDPNKWIELAASAAKDLIDNGPYRLYTTGHPESDYRELFACETTNKFWNNPEVMYWREYIAGESTTSHNLQTYWHHLGGVTKSFVDDYLMIDGKPPVTTEGVSPLYNGDKTVEDVFVNRDIRMRQTVLFPGDAVKYNFFPNYSLPQIVGMTSPRQTPTGFHCIKYWNEKEYYTSTNQRTQPAIIMRYAEALLIYAEAKAELGTITQGDLDITINALRDRVGMPHLMLNNLPVDPRYTDVSPVIAEIRRERKIELAFEGVRLFDIYRWKWGRMMRVPDMGIRWDADAKVRYALAIKNTKSSVIQDPITGEMNEYIDVYKGTGYENPVFDENKHYLWPIPLSSLAQNPNIAQNPGWE